MIFFGSGTGSGSDFHTVSDLYVAPYPDPAPDPAKSFGSERIRIHNTAIDTTVLSLPTTYEAT
jgi:hypothetical protein